VEFIAMPKSLATFAAALALCVLGTYAAAQQAALPALIRIVVPAAPGSSTDVFARAVAARLGPRIGSNVIVENRAGGSTMIGSAAVAKGPKDGSMLLINSTTLVSTAATMREPPLDVVGDLTPVAMLEQNPLVVAVSLKSNITTPGELVAAARAAPDTVTHGTIGVGSIVHVAVEQLNDAARIQLRHVPYRGTALAVTDMAGGNIDMVMATYATVAPAVRSGRARLIAVTSAEPSPAFSGVPTMASVVPGYTAELWLALFAPAGTPAPVVLRLNREINDIARTRELRDMMDADGGTPQPLTPEQLAARIRNDYIAFKKLATDKKIVSE
jgi:tripartite-type tricarboxylate transporter receptor subunit TctC